jgi:CubicO group peptidase (beta-lactamase class C family)
MLGLAFAYGGVDKMVRRIAELPLEWEPGTRWQYSAGSDVIGRIVEVVSGMTLDKYFAARIFEPLGMTDTGFSVPESGISRFPPLYEATAGGMALHEAPEVSAWRQGKVDTFCGGGGLVGTIDDYWRFAEMLRNGGELNGERILSTRTLRLAACNHLPAILPRWQPMFGPKPNSMASGSACWAPSYSIQRRRKFRRKSATMAGAGRQAPSSG